MKAVIMKIMTIAYKVPDCKVAVEASSDNKIKVLTMLKKQLSVSFYCKGLHIKLYLSLGRGKGLMLSYNPHRYRNGIID